MPCEPEASVPFVLERAHDATEPSRRNATGKYSAAVSGTNCAVFSAVRRQAMRRKRADATLPRWDASSATRTTATCACTHGIWIEIVVEVRRTHVTVCG